jgi:hypothetical protein
MRRDAQGFLVSQEQFSVPSGSPVHLVVDYDDLYICNLVESIELLEVWGEVDGAEVDMRPVPSNYYNFYNSTLVDGKTCTALTMPTPLVARTGEGWTGKIWTTVVSNNNFNGVSALRHLIYTYSVFVDDATTYTSVATKVAGYPISFALLEKVPLLKTLKNIAFQLRVGLIFRGSTILYKYISENIAAQYNLTDANIIDEGMVFNHDTDLLRATRLKAKWQLDYTGREDYQRESTYENNINVQLIEQEFDFYIYNIEVLVKKTLAFWGYRYSNLWYIIELKAPLDSMVLEAFDIVGVRTSDYSVRTVRGEVQKVKIDTTNNLVGIRTLMAGKPTNDSYNIGTIDTSAKLFCVAGDARDVFLSGDSITIAGSTGNDGTYTVNGGPTYNSDTGYTCIKVSQTISSPIADGYITPTTHDPIEDSNFFTGDPANPITPAPPFTHPSSGLTPATHLEPLPTDVIPISPGPSDPGDDTDPDDGDSDDNLFFLKIIQGPEATWQRGSTIRMKVEIQDAGGNPSGPWYDADDRQYVKTVGIELHSPDELDGIHHTSVSKTSAGYQFNWYATLNRTRDHYGAITGGSGKDEGAFLTVFTSNAATITSDLFTILDKPITTLRFDVSPTTVVRDTNFTASITGGGAATVLSVSASTPEPGDKLYDDATGLEITEITLDGTGNYDSTHWRVSGGLSTAGTLIVTVSDVVNQTYTDASFSAPIASSAVTVLVSQNISFSDKKQGNYYQLVMTTCATSLPVPGDQGVIDGMFALGVEIQDANGVKQTDISYDAGGNAAIESNIKITHVDAAGDNIQMRFGAGDEGQKALGLAGGNRGADFANVQLIDGAWSSTENYVVSNSEFNAADTPITFTFTWGGPYSELYPYPTNETSVTCVIPKAGLGNLEQIIYERQFAAGIPAADLIDLASAPIVLATLQSAVDKMAPAYLADNEYGGGESLPITHQSYPGISSTVASTRAALAELALTFKYVVNRWNWGHMDIVEFDDSTSPEEISVRGDQTDKLTNGDTFLIEGSTHNDASYTIIGAVTYDAVNGKTIIPHNGTGLETSHTDGVVVGGRIGGQGHQSIEFVETGDGSFLPSEAVGSGRVWPELKEVTNDVNETPATVTFTYSFIIAGTSLNDHDTGGSAPAVTLGDGVDSSVSNAQFKQEITDALQEWKEVFEDVYPWLTLVFQNLGDETGTSVGSDISTPAYSLTEGAALTENVGDLRFGMHNIDGASGTLAHAGRPQVNTLARLGVVGTAGGDTHFDVSEDWRQDATSSGSDVGAWSVKYVAAHEIGHALGLPHSDDTGSILHAASPASADESFASSFPSGLIGSTVDRQHITTLYGPQTDAAAVVFGNTNINHFGSGSGSPTVSINAAHTDYEAIDGESRELYPAGVGNDSRGGGYATVQSKSVQQTGCSGYSSYIESYSTLMEIARFSSGALPAEPLHLLRRRNRFLAQAVVPRYNAAHYDWEVYRDPDGQIYNRFGQDWLPETVGHWVVLWTDLDWRDLTLGIARQYPTYEFGDDNVSISDHQNFATKYRDTNPIYDTVPPNWSVSADAPLDYSASIVGWMLIEPTCITEWEFVYNKSVET